jgi:hypothetical protein
MDALEKFLGGGQAVAEPPKKSGGQTPSDAQNKRNETALAMIKEELRKNQELAAQGNKEAQINVAALNREIARFEKKSPVTAKAVAAAPAVPVAAAAAPVAQAATSDPLEAFLSGKPAPPAQPAAQPTTQPAAQPTTQPAAISGSNNRYQGYSAEEEQKVGKVKQKVPMVRQILTNALTMATPMVQPKSPELAQRIAGAVDTLYEVLPTTYGAVQQAIVRPFTTPAKAEELGKEAGQFMFPSQPLGKVFGITEKEAYKQPLGGVTEPIAEQINKMFNVLGMTPEQISEKTGISAPDIRNMVVIGSLAIPQAIKEVSPVVGKVTEAAKQTKVVQQLTEAAKELEFLRSDTAANKPTKSGGLTSEQLQAQFEARGGNLKQNAEQLNKNYEQQRASANEPESVQQPILDTNGQAIGTADLGTAKPTRADSEFKPVEYAENGLPLDEQFARAKAMQRVLGEDHAADLSALEGKGKERATNYQTSKSDTPLGNYLAERFKDEQRRLQIFADQQAQKTGGIVGLDESAKYKRGEAILDPLKKLEDYFNKETKRIYAERDAQAATIPVESNNILKILNDDSLTLANTETIGLANIAKARMRQLNMIDKDGNLLPTDAKTAENFRQFLNENFDRKNANLHRALKIAVDEDVLANLDTNSPIYKDARSLVELRKNTLDNPKGISAILDESGPNNINRKVDKEKISQNIANMSVEQFTHVIDTLKNMPPELRVAGNQALANIKSQFASNISALAGKPKDLTKFMNDNREVMPRLFNAEEMNNFRDLHNVAHILKTDTGYPGAAVQKINIEQKLTGKIGQQILQKGGAAGAELMTGGAGGGLPAVFAHEYIGAKLEKGKLKKLEKAEAEAFKNAQTRFVPIKDLINK